MAKRRMSNRGQAGAMMNAAASFLLLLTLGMVLALGADVNDGFRDSQPQAEDPASNATAAFNVSTYVGQSFDQASQQMPNVGTVIAAVLIITLLLGIFLVVRRLS